MDITLKRNAHLKVVFNIKELVRNLIGSTKENKEKKKQNL